MIDRALLADGGDQAAAAKRLGLTKAALVKRLK
jgi:transcriptional regulator with GAF, ATPase, and Fis domain